MGPFVPRGLDSLAQGTYKNVQYNISEEQGTNYHEARPLPLVAPFRVHPKIAKSYKAHSKADNSSWTHVLVLTRANDDLSTVVFDVMLVYVCVLHFCSCFA